MKEIKLTQEKVTMVDDEVYEYLMQWKWCTVYWKGSKSFYAIRSNNISKKIGMHRVVLEYYGYNLTGLEVDHKNHDTLNNQLSNLRPCTKRQNAENRIDNTSGYPGVYWNKHDCKWFSMININGIKKYLESYNTAQQAFNVRQQYKKIHNIA